ncbi:peptidase (plasmid) [Azospirillum argentinense]|uniref:Peptidase n=1 Tax=Azospirillum argentinense TaxID=2970906 RepID=A0A2K1FR65_9PROT|nr:EcsC family protein [Azospirillum argentinense]PNQ95026.1 peptidase [Azospirillum argentinense]
MTFRWSEQDKSELEVAVKNLEVPSFMTRATDLIGTPIEAGLKMLPEGAQEKIAKATHVALDKAMSAALLSLQDRSQRGASPWLHTGAVAATGALGGFFGISALLAELPVTTGIMLRSIADIARSEGEDLSAPNCAMACMEVFALGSPATKNDDEADTGYFAVRAALAAHVRQAAEYLAKTETAKGSAPVLVKLITVIAARFNITVSEKAMLQLVPVVGAAGGAIINTLFISTYQDLARGHFTIRRLERTYGAEEVRLRYNEVRTSLGLLTKPKAA